MMQVAGVSLEMMKTAAARAEPSGRSTGAAFDEILRDTGSASAGLHRVKRGDNLSRICRDYLRAQGEKPTASQVYTAVDRVAAYNGLRNKDLIHPGQSLDLSVLDPDPVVEAADLRATVDLPLDPTPAAVETAAEAAPASDPPAAAVPLVRSAEASADAATSWVEALQQGANTQFAAILGPLGLVSAPLGPLEPMGPLGPPDVIAALPAPLNVERALSLVNAAVQKAQEAGGASTDNPWARILGTPARLTSEFGVRRDPLTRQWQHHDGIDLATAKGSQVRPYMPGEVVYSGWQPGYGKVVIVRHDDGLETVYGHNSKNLVNVGQRVSADTVLAEVGSTGRSTGNHLHFEVRRNGKALDPIPFLASAPSVDVAEAF